MTLDPSDRSLREVLRLDGPRHDRRRSRCSSTCWSSRSSPPVKASGAVSWLSYAFRLMYLPIGVFGVSVATAALPVLSRHAALDQLHQVRRDPSRTACGSC